MRAYDRKGSSSNVHRVLTAESQQFNALFTAFVSVVARGLSRGQEPQQANPAPAKLHLHLRGQQQPHAAQRHHLTDPRFVPGWSPPDVRNRLLRFEFCHRGCRHLRLLKNGRSLFLPFQCHFFGKFLHVIQSGVAYIGGGVAYNEEWFMFGGRLCWAAQWAAGS